MHYNARLYDPALGRFVSADTIVPGRASASGGSAATLGHDKNAALQALTVAFHELPFTEELNRENRISSQQGFWFQLDDEAQQDYGTPWGQATRRRSTATPMCSTIRCGILTPRGIIRRWWPYSPPLGSPLLHP
jgi:hypothetical protein